MAKIKWNIIWGIAITAVFAGLLTVRLGIFEKPSPTQIVDTKTVSTRPSETWMNIYQNKLKIGVIHRKFHKLESGGYETAENVTMHINAMGITQALHLSTETLLKPDLSLASFRFEMNSSLFRFVARGDVKDKMLSVFSGLPQAQTKTVIPITDIPQVSGNIYETAFHSSLEKNQSRDLNFFDPSTLGIRKIAVTRGPDEVIPIMGKRVLTQKFCADFMGAKHCAWLDKNGEVLRETGLLGLSMEKVSPETAREGIAYDSLTDLTQIASIPSNISIANPSKLTRIEIKLTGLRNPGLLLRSERQQFRRGILTIAKEQASASTFEKTGPSESLHRFLQASALIQSDHPHIIAQANKIVSSGDTPYEKTYKIVEWVYKNIEKKPVLSVPNALEVLTQKAGDCNEHSVLTAALLRAASIPAQIEAGLVYLNGRFYYHAWNAAYLGRWVTLDSVFNQIPADVTHIRLASGEGAEQLDLLGIMGNIKLEVISTSYD